MQISFPASFVLNYAHPTPAELAYGIQNHWISAEAAVEISVAKLAAGKPLGEQEERLAMLLRDEYYKVIEIADEMAYSDEPIEQRERLWIFLALVWIYQHRRDYDDPLLAVEELAADFSYPDFLLGLIRWMPAEMNQPSGVPAIYERWSRLLDTLEAEYQQRE